MNALSVYIMIQRKGISAVITTFPAKVFDPKTNTTTLGAPVLYNDIKVIPPYNNSGEYGKTVLITSGRGLTGIANYNLAFNVEVGLQIDVLGKKWMVEAVSPLSSADGVLCYLLEIVSN